MAVLRDLKEEEKAVEEELKSLENEIAGRKTKRDHDPEAATVPAEAVDDAKMLAKKHKAAEC